MQILKDEPLGFMANKPKAVGKEDEVILMIILQLVSCTTSNCTQCKKVKKRGVIVLINTVPLFQQTNTMWPHTLALQGVQKFLKTTMPGVLLLRNIVL